MSTQKTPYAVICLPDPDMPREYPGCGKVYLTEKQYLQQLDRPNQTWRCPACGSEASWDDEHYERYLDVEAARVEGWNAAMELAARTAPARGEAILALRRKTVAEEVESEEVADGR